MQCTVQYLIAVVAIRQFNSKFVGYVYLTLQLSSLP